MGLSADPPLPYSIFYRAVTQHRIRVLVLAVILSLCALNALMATFTDDPNVRYCRCGNIKILKVSQDLSEVHLVRVPVSASGLVQRYTFLAELVQEGIVVHCRCCNTDTARVQGVTCLADLDKPSVVALIDTIDGVPPKLTFSILSIVD